MRKIFSLLIIVIVSFIVKEIQAQTAQANLQKYWWYRYRLVNDFMKIGEACGESNVAQRRRLHSWTFCGPSGTFEPNNHDGNNMSYEDQTIDLGQYISVLATEYKILNNNSLSKRRTVYELYYALKAFDRLDIVAEERCRDFEATKDCDNISPHDGPDPHDNDQNGFFIRDDVPINFVADNLLHFNRPKICHPIEDDQNVGLKVTRGAISMRIDGLMGASCSDTWNTLHPWTPHYPNEESQDQVKSLYEGLALLIYYINPTESYGGINLKNYAKDLLLRMCTYFGYSGFRILNPLATTPTCVFGEVNINLYNNPVPNVHCDAGGALIFPSATPIVKGLSNLGASWSGGQASEILFLATNSTPYYTFYQLLKHYNPPCNQDFLLFPVTFTAIAKSWNIFGVNVSKYYLKQRSHACSLRWPHIPLIYRLFHGGVLDNPGYLSFADLLNKAPTCGKMMYEYPTNSPNNTPMEWNTYNVYPILTPSSYIL